MALAALSLPKNIKFEMIELYFPSLLEQKDCAIG